MLQLDVQLPRRVRAAVLGVERATGASHATRDGAHLVLHSPFLEQNREAGPAMLVGALRMILASLAAAAAGARAGTNLIPGCASHGRVTGRGGRGVDP